MTSNCYFTIAFLGFHELYLFLNNLLLHLFYFQ